MSPASSYAAIFPNVILKRHFEVDKIVLLLQLSWIAETGAPVTMQSYELMGKIQRLQQDNDKAGSPSKQERWTLEI